MKGLEGELDRLTSRLVSAMANRDSLEEVLVISLKFFSSIFCQIFISSAIFINTRTYIGDQFAQEEEVVLCAGCNQRLLEPGLQADEGRFSQSITDCLLYFHLQLLIRLFVQQSIDTGSILPASPAMSARSL